MCAMCVFDRNKIALVLYILLMEVFIENPYICHRVRVCVNVCNAKRRRSKPTFKRPIGKFAPKKNCMPLPLQHITYAFGGHQKWGDATQLRVWGRRYMRVLIWCIYSLTYWWPNYDKRTRIVHIGKVLAVQLCKHSKMAQSLGSCFFYIYFSKQSEWIKSFSAHSVN